MWQIFFGTGSNDTLIGTIGDDVYRGFAGNDLLVDLGGGDLFAGGSGIDTLLLDPEVIETGIILTDSLLSVTVDLGLGFQGGGGLVGHRDTLVSIKNYRHLGGFTMNIVGSGENSFLQTDRGNDTLATLGSGPIKLVAVNLAA